MTHAFRHEDRVTLTGPQRVKFFLDRGGKCAGPCQRKLPSGSLWHIDHIIALENGGTNDPSNLQVLCDWCHKPKTAEDHAKAAKIRAVAVSTYLPSNQKKRSGFYKPKDAVRVSFGKYRMGKPDTQGTE